LTASLSTKKMWGTFMKSYIKWFAVILSLVLIFVGGMIFGSYNATNRINKQVENSLYSLDATQIKIQIDLLELMRSGDYDKVQKKLEVFVDLGLANLAPYVAKPEFNSNVEINSAIIMAKMYRQKYSDHKINRIMENSVKKTLDFVK
jgi:uncharacterized protein YneF (UPF0154 family)